MAPKAKVKAKAKAKALAKAKAGAMRRLGAMRIGPRGVARRPAAAPFVRGAPVPRELWRSGQLMKAGDIPVDELAKDVEVIAEDMSYFGAPGRLAGVITRLEVERDATHVLLRALGTDSEALLRHCSGQPKEPLRLHLCPEGCAGERVPENLVHGRKMRLGKGAEAEEPWTRNLVGTDHPGEDELAGLREKKKEHDRARGGDRKPSTESRPRSKEKKKEKKRGRSSKKKRKEQRSRDRSRSRKKSVKEVQPKKDAVEKVSSSSSSSGIRLDGRRPRGASVKSPQVLFAGTGLDFKDKVRRRVARRAKRLVRRKKADGSGSSCSRSSSASKDEDFDQDEGFFDSETKVQRVAENCPGALGARSLTSMRKALLESSGLEDHTNILSPTAMKYFRQELQRKTSGPVGRELITLSSAVDLLLRGRVAQAVDVMLQRIKSVEATIAGSHWSVSQRLEIPPLDAQLIAPREEIITAQKAAAIDARSKFLASQPDGRGKSKGGGKSKEPGYQDWRSDRDKGKSKGSGRKGKDFKKTEEAAK